MKKEKFTLLIAILVLFMGQSNAKDFRFTAHQDKILLHCDTEDSTFIYLTLSDPNGELTGQAPFTVNWKINRIAQLEHGLSTVDTLHLRDTVVFEVFDNTSTSVWLDSTIIYDEAKPWLTIYPGYQDWSEKCIPTGGTKGQVPWGYSVENIILLQERDSTAKISTGNHFMIDSVFDGTHQMKYSINACTYNWEFTINSYPKPDLEMDQLYMATCEDGKFNLMLSDSLVIDSVWLLNNDEMLLVNDTSYHLHVPGGDNEIVVYSKNCEFYENFFVESEDANVVKIEAVNNPHEYLSTGTVELSSTIEIKEAWFIIDEIETTTVFESNSVIYDYLPEGEYTFRIKDKGACITEVEYNLKNLTGNPVPTGFSSDSIFDFKIDGTPINQVPEIEDQYRLVIHKIIGSDQSQIVFDSSRGDKLPWDKTLNGELQYGYFLYYLEITNPAYKGKTPIKSYFRLFIMIVEDGCFIFSQTKN